MDITIFGVIVDAISTSIVKLQLSGSLTELMEKDGLKELIEKIIAAGCEDWKDVLSGKRAAVLFEADNPSVRIRMNDGTVKLLLD